VIFHYTASFLKLYLQQFGGELASVYFPNERYKYCLFIILFHRAFRVPSLKLRICKVDYIEGEMHFLIEEFEPAEASKQATGSFTYEIARKVSRKQAVKPLNLKRWE
jgi:hypothetical protein